MTFIISITPGLSRLRSKLFSRTSLRELADKETIICPATERWEPAAIALADEFSLVRKARHFASLSEQWEVLTAGKRRHLPTTSLSYKNALIADGTVYANHGYENIRKCKRSPIAFADSVTFDHAVCCADMGSDLFFGRWLCDALAKEILAKEQGCAAINQDNAQRIHEAGYRSLLSLDAHKPSIARVRNLTLIDDRGYNDDHVRRYAILRQKIRNEFPDGPYGRVYIARGKLAEAGRDIANSDEFSAKLSSLGFQIIHPESMAPVEICNALASAAIVAGVEGSALAHALLAMPEGSSLLTIQPAHRFSSALKSVAESVGISFAYLVADDSGEGLFVDISRFERTVGLLGA